MVDSTRPSTLTIRDYTTKDPIDDGSNNDVYGRLSYGGGNYTITFYSLKNNVETPYTFATSKAIDLACVLVSRPFKNLTWDRFLDFEWYDFSGAIGSMSDSNVTVSNMNWLYNGLTDQHAINVLGDTLGEPNVSGAGASLVATNNTVTGGSAGYFSGTDVQANLNEITLQLGGATSTTFDFTHNGVACTDNTAVYANLNALNTYLWNLLQTGVPGSGANLVGIQNADTYFVATTVEGALNELYEDIQAVSAEKVTEVSSGIVSGVSHTLPGSLTYTPATYGANLDVYYSGQLLTAGAGNDYTEDAGAPSTSIKFLFSCPNGKNLTYMARK